MQHPTFAWNIKVIKIVHYLVASAIDTLIAHLAKRIKTKSSNQSNHGFTIKNRMVSVNLIGNAFIWESNSQSS